MRKEREGSKREMGRGGGVQLMSEGSLSPSVHGMIRTMQLVTGCF